MKNYALQGFAFLIGCGITTWAAYGSSPLTAFQSQLFGAFAVLVTLGGVGLLVMERKGLPSRNPLYRSWVGFLAGGALTGVLIASYL